MEFIKNKNIVVLDIETTGIKANTDKIIELYMLKVYNNEVVEEYHSKFNPEIEIPLFISNLTGIYQWHVNSSPSIDQEIKNIKTFIGQKSINSGKEVLMLSGEAISIEELLFRPAIAKDMAIL